MFASVAFSLLSVEVLVSDVALEESVELDVFVLELDVTTSTS